MIFYFNIVTEAVVYLFRHRAWHIVLPVTLFSSLYLATLVAGFQGIANGFGWGWAVVALIAALGFRLSLPLNVSAYIHAMNAWGFPWAMAVAFATGPLVLIWIENQLSYARTLGSPWRRELCFILIGSLMHPLFFVRLVAGFQGIESGMNQFWAVAAVASLFVFRVDLPLVAGAYFYATNTWSWHPAMAVLFATSLDIYKLVMRYMTVRMLKMGR